MLILFRVVKTTGVQLSHKVWTTVEHSCTTEHIRSPSVMQQKTLVLNAESCLNEAVSKCVCVCLISWSTCTDARQCLDDHPLVLEGAGRGLQDGEKNLPEKHLR